MGSRKKGMGKIGIEKKRYEMVTCEKKVKGKIGIGKLRYGICINYSRKNRYREKKV